MCECVKTMNALLKDRNARIVTSTRITKSMNVEERICIQVETISGKKKKLPTVVAVHCPFCGQEQLFED
jgi:hypothetical protein